MFLMRLAYVVALSLTIAGLVHIGSLLGVPRVAVSGPYERLAQLGPDSRFATLDDVGANANLLPFRDPAFVTAACRFDLSGGPVTVKAALPATYGVLAVHNRSGQPFYALTDRAAVDGQVEVTILSADDAAAVALEEPTEGRQALRIASPTQTGFILLRLFVAGESARPGLRDLAAKASCSKAGA